MAARRQVLLALIAMFACMGASYPTANFVVHAPTPEIAKQVGDWAEYYRRQKAVEWLGQEMAPWPQRCPLHVTVSMNGPSGATSFNFGRDAYGNGVVMGQRMEIQGSLDRLLASVLPHEITHTVFAYHFKTPVPRWADEGGSVLSEDNIERDRHNKLVRHILNSGQQIRMRTLFGLKEYPRNVMALYAQGYSIANFLVGRSNRQTFLNFVAHGMTQGWDSAVWQYYRHRSVEELEEAWLQHLRETKDQPHIEVAQDQRSRQYDQPRGTVVRLTVPPSTLEARPASIVRGQMPTEEGNQTFGGGMVQAQPTGRPQYLPEYQLAADPGWQASPSAPQPRYNEERPHPEPVRMAQPTNPVPVQLGPPQFSNPPVGPASAMPANVSPVGYPR